ncbi:hypothetical protein SALINJAH_190 [Bacillus phage SalinJah]|uniref:Uncharacterized protein n=1 Tax=Bacillus phage SalinJah TaxID=1837830 RepID=A0A173GBS2_9CAUD|nr:hypothetical protein SALINJAH_190 [Bacillus phage SalinJah]ANH50747.1 hypothetical protein SALINJAH_190 [Bacillus phage SalinJah]
MIEYSEFEIEGESTDKLYDTLEYVKDDIQRAVRNSFWTTVYKLIEFARDIEAEIRVRSLEKDMGVRRG